MKNINAYLQKLVGARANEVICGGNFNGSVVILVFNDRLVLTVQCCWRLIQNDSIIASWNEADNSIGSNFELSVATLENDLVSDINISKYFDLDIGFKSGKKFQLFCDINKFWPEDYFDENWFICDKELDFCFAINRNLKIIKTKYSTF